MRLIGVDTPETGRPLAQQATDFARRFVAGKALALRPSTPGRDRYGRQLADVLADGESLSEALVGAGLAWIYETREPRLLALQAQAVDGRRGVHERLGAAGPGPWLATRQRFHRSDCPALGGSAGKADLSGDLPGMLKAGLSPCRTCLPWPP